MTITSGYRMTDVERVRRYRLKHPRRYKSSQLKAKYGITLDQWEELFKSQNNSCAICRTSEPTGTGWHTDHDHATHQVRGILCNDCNLGLGRFKDDPDVLIVASEYLNSRITF